MEEQKVEAQREKRVRKEIEEVKVEKVEEEVKVEEKVIENIEPTISDLEVAKKMIKISQSASDRKLEFNLKFETVKRLMNYSTCYYTNKPFGDEGGLYARSFDRVDSAKGYIEGNVVACTVDINQKKANLSLEELTMLYNRLINFKG